MKKVLAIFTAIIAITISAIIGWWVGKTPQEKKALTSKEIIKSKPLEKYTIENLSKTDIAPGTFSIGKVAKKENDFASYKFSFEFSPDLSTKKTKKTTGQINLPNKKEKYPIIVMLRGYVDQELYKTGDGTRNAARFFAKNGFITIAPDFLGYADSDEESGNIFESRFQTYTTVLSLLKTLEQIPQNSKLLSTPSQLTNQLINYSTINLWGHSNGGQIALTILEITKTVYPTTLWAPVSKPFPYSILYYTDESEDRGKLIRRELAKFEDLYDTDLYSITEYFENINAPIQIHQGLADDSVPIEWSNDLVNILEGFEKDVDYFKYPLTDHNMRPNWDTAVSRDLEFFHRNY